MDLHVDSSATTTSTSAASSAATAAAMNSTAASVAAVDSTTSRSPTMVSSASAGTSTTASPIRLSNHVPQHLQQHHNHNAFHNSNNSGSGSSIHHNRPIASRSSGTGSNSNINTATATTSSWNAASFFSPENVASLPPPGLSAPSQAMFLNSHILSYVAVVPKQQSSQAPSVSSQLPHKSSSNNNSNSSNHNASSSSHSHRSSSTRSLYRPLTATSVSSSTPNHAANSSGNNPSNHNTPSQPQPTKASPTQQSSTERVLMCLDLRSLLSPSHTLQGDTGTATTSSDQPSGLGASKPRIRQQQPESVPLLQWNHSNTNSFATRTSNAAASNTTQSEAVGVAPSSLSASYSTLSTVAAATAASNQSSTTTTSLHSAGSGMNGLSYTNAVLPNNRPTATRSMSKRRALSSSAITAVPSSTAASTDNHHATTSATATTAPNTVSGTTRSSLSLEERLRRERQRSSTAAAASGSLTQFSWVLRKPNHGKRRISEAAAAAINSSNSTTAVTDSNDTIDVNNYRILVPSRGNLYIQNGLKVKSRDRWAADENEHGIDDSLDGMSASLSGSSSFRYCTCIHDKSATGLSAMDAQLSPDGSMVAWTCEGELYVQSAEPRIGATSTNAHSASFNNAAATTTASSMMLDDSFSVASSEDGTAAWPAAAVESSTTTPAILVSFGASQSETCSITHGVADFVAQEEMDRYRGFWWHPDSNAILFTRNDESDVPLYRIMHHSNNSALPPSSSSTASMQNDHSSSQHYESSHSSRGFAPPSKSSSSSVYEDHRYPFAGRVNPVVKLALVQIDKESVLHQATLLPKSTTTTTTTSNRSKPAVSQTAECREGVETSAMDGNSSHDKHDDSDDGDPMQLITAQDIAAENWAACQWLDAPREANEYLARVHVLPDGCVIAQWQNRAQTCTVLYRIDLRRKRSTPNPNDHQQPGSGRGRTLLVERSDVWINLHHMFHVLSRPIHPDECVQQQQQQPMDGSQTSQQPPARCPPMPNPLPDGSFSFLFASERTGYAHLYLYTYCPGINGEQAVLLKAVTEGNWVVESILGVDLEKDVVYFIGTYDSVLERHLYAMPLLGTKNKHTWRSGCTATIAQTPSGDGTALNPPNAQALASTDTSNGSGSNGGGTIRLGLSKVIHALSGGKTDDRDDCMLENDSCPSDEPDEIALAPNQDGDICPTRITVERGMHNIVMDPSCRYFVDTSSDLNRPTTVKIYELPTHDRLSIRRMLTLYDAVHDDVSIMSALVSGENKDQEPVDLAKVLPAPELLSFPTSDGTETLHAALYRPDPKVHGPGPYPLVCAVYGGPHVQRVNRSWSQSADMRAQRLRSLGFCLVKCDNRGSSRRGLAFESAISRRLGRLEVLDQVAAVRQLIVRGIVDPLRVGIYGWSYGGYLSAMCLCRAPDVFHVAVAGAPVTSWDGYDTHYTERYMGLPADNPAGYRESAVFDHVPNMRGKLMIVHGLIDENVHFRHTTRLINKLIAAGKDYDLLIFPEERHSPRRLRDRIYMEQRISDYFLRHLGPSQQMSSYPTALDIVTASLGHGGGGLPGLRTLAGHL